MLPLLSLLLLPPLAEAAPAAVPTRQIPASVLQELQLLENRFEVALADDCDSKHCYSNGCVYVDHAVADQPRSRSLPGLSDEPGPSGTDAQVYLTSAQCAFSNEASVSSADAAAISRRLSTRLSQGWTVVSVDHSALPVIPSTVEPEVEEAAAPEPPPEPPVVEAPPDWTRELWEALLPHAFWMVGVGLVTGAATALIWAGRRVGRASLEEQALLAQLSQPAGASTEGGETPPPPEAPSAETDAYVAQQEAIWRARLEAMDPEDPDPELVALLRERLRANDLPLLAKAVLRFPERLPAAFPQDGETATAKLELAELLRRGDSSTLPDDLSFFRALERYSLAATLASQPDAGIVRGLHEDFGAAGLAELIRRNPPRMGALLFALAPPAEKHEAVRLLSEPQVESLSQQLLSSNRMDRSETAALLQVLRHASSSEGVAVAVPAEISDRGVTFDAAGALAILLPRLSAPRRAALFEAALARFRGALPMWHRDIFVPDMLTALEPEARIDLLLAVDVEPLAAWLSVQEPATAARTLEGAPDALRLSISATPPPPSRAAQLERASAGRIALARAFQRQLARQGLAFERVVLMGAAGSAP